MVETRSLLPSNGTRNTICVASVSDNEDMKKVADVAGTWDVLILNAAHLGRPSSIAKASWMIGGRLMKYEKSRPDQTSRIVVDGIP